MITSMTGYGKSVNQLQDRKITVEIRTLNSKSLDLNLRIPSAYREKELELRQLTAAQLSRGKVDVSLYVEHTGTTTGQQLDIAKVENYISQISAIDGVAGNNKLKLVEIATTFPDVFKSVQEEVDEKDFSIIMQLVADCLEEVNDFRNKEGAILKAEFDKRIANISSLLDQVLIEDKQRLDDVRTRLEKAVSELKEKLDENRFEQELIYYLEKYDITEEKVRLQNHLNYFTETMETSGSQGKKLGFISQEIGREINTIGSKANHAAMQQLVVQMKDELEKIKEQMLNVL
ncbi:YicC/YloC family endoribonuclease [Nonlabens marinus]|uniref:Protein YicC n=1 Tax=Nonlabens marinus S1-08 TaxID=1454201 RepID=W8VPQ4_9FLAO|nr:YicC/YloC family endoribonuclease [Nonlabens marinus]BAO54625.1 protein YicC [Nonlabens marinus S1-08]